MAKPVVVATERPLNFAAIGLMLRSRVRQGVIMGFVQIIEIETTRPDEIEALVGGWRAKTAGTRTAQRGTFTKDRDRPNTYVQIVEFPSYEAAMVNSELPETAELSRNIAALCDGPITFRNLEVRSVEEM
jgi:hypothetical protein